MNKKLGQLFVIGVEGKSLTEEEKKFIVDNNIGGIILFSRNVESPQQVHELCTEIQSLRRSLPDQAPLTISIDMEGGRVARLKEPFTVWPPLYRLTEIDSSSASFKFSYTMGQELRAVGINMNYSPCVDVLTNPKNELIGDRSLGSDPEMVSKHASALVRGFIKSEVIPCAKHFPGHGNTILDSHEELPIDEVSKEEMDKTMLPAFKKVFRSRLNVVMTAHIKYPALDAEWPATLSEKILTGLLREELRYRDLIITDDLDMKALTNHYSREFIPVQALKAGADILLYCNEPESHKIGHDAVQKAAANKELDMLSLTRRCDAVAKLKEKMLKQPDPLPWDQVKDLVGHTDHIALSEGITSGNLPEDLKS